MSETKGFSSLKDVHDLIHKSVEDLSEIKLLLHTLKNSQSYCDDKVHSLDIDHIDDIVPIDEGEIIAIVQVDENLNIFSNEALDLTTKLNNLFANGLLVKHYYKVLTRLEFPSSLLGVYIRAIKYIIISVNKPENKKALEVIEMLESQIKTAEIIKNKIDDLWCKMYDQVDDIKSFLFKKEEVYL